MSTIHATPDEAVWLMDGVAMRFPHQMADKVRLITMSRGERFLSRDEHLSNIFIVHRGIVMIYSMDDFGNEHCIVLISEGEFVGEMEALLNADRVVYSAKAYTDCELIAIPVGTFRWWIDTDAQALRRLTETLGRKLYSVSTQLARKASFDAMSRLILALEFFGGGRIDHTRQELADACSMSIRTINRCVRKLMDDRLISIERGKICISESQFNALRGLIRDSDPGVSAPAYARRRN